MDLTPLLGIATILGVFITLALFFFGSTKSFDSEYRSTNNKIVSILVGEFNREIDEYIAKRNVVRGDDALNPLLPHLEKITQRGDSIHDWVDHIRSGKNLLRRLSGDLMLAGFLFSFAVAVASYVDDESAASIALSLGVIGIMPLMQAVTRLKEYCAIASRIDKAEGNVIWGKPPLSEED